jgi:uncharacterized protein
MPDEQPQSKTPDEARIPDFSLPREERPRPAEPAPESEILNVIPADALTPFLSGPAGDPLPAAQEGILAALPAESDVYRRRVRGPRPPHPGIAWAFFWWLVYFLGLQIFVGVGVAVVYVVVYLLSGGSREGIPQLVRSPEFLSVNMGVIEVVSIIFCVFIVRIVVGRDWMRQLGVRRPSLTHVVLALLAVPGMLALSEFAYLVSGKVLPTFNYQAQMTHMFAEWPVWFAVLAVGLGPALNEELWCRGFLGRGLVGHYGPLCGVLLTSLLFGLAHLDPPHIVATFVMGICLHYVYLMARSLWVSMLMHFVNNSLAVLGIAVLQDTGTESLGAALAKLAGPDNRGAKIVQYMLEPAPFELPYGPYAFLLALGLLVAVFWAFYQSRARPMPVEASNPDPWRPAYPGVEHPPPASGTVVRGRLPGWLPSLAMMGALAGFVALAYK